MILRPYQLKSKVDIRDMFRKGHRAVVFELPTGGGKTVTFADWVAETLRKNHFNRCLILTDRVELLGQAGGTLAKFGVYPFALTAGIKNKDINFGHRCFLSMVETYWKRLKKYPQLANFDLVIIDECHKGNFKKLFAKWAELNPKMKIVGCSATPISTKRKDPLSNYYQDIVSVTNIPELIEIGSLMPVKTYSAHFNRSKLVRDYSNEDGFSEQSQMLELDKREVYAGLLEKYKKHCLRPDGSVRKTVIFNVNVAHSQNVCQSFNDAGFRAIHVDGYLHPDERRKRIKAFEAGEYDVICNPNILTAGWDYPPVEVVVFNRATKSLTMWLQALGRGSRPCPEIGKDSFIVLDMAMNWTELGLWDFEHDWKAIFHRKPSDREPGSAPMKVCPECGYINHAAARQCQDEECDYVFPVKEKQAPQNPEFIQISAAVANGMTEERALECKYIVDNWKENPYDEQDVKTLIDIAAVMDWPWYWPLRTIEFRCKTFEQYNQEIQEFADWQKKRQEWVNSRLDKWKRLNN